MPNDTNRSGAAAAKTAPDWQAVRKQFPTADISAASCSAAPPSS